MRAVVIYETLELGRSLVLQGKDFGFYSSALGNQWISKAVARSDSCFKKDRSDFCIGNGL